MKRKLLLSLILIPGLALTYSCREYDDEPVVQKISPKLKDIGGTRVSPEEALTIADSYLELIAPMTRSSRKNPTIDVYGKSASSHHSFHSTEIPDTLMYIINYGGDGFALVAADYRMDDIYAISDEGSFHLSDTLHSPEMKNLIGTIENYAVSGLEATTRAETITSRDGRVWSVSERIEKKVNSKWGQGHPFNQFCPSISGQKTKAGCVPIAISQIMYYHGYPDRHTNTRTQQMFTYNWDQMKLITNESIATIPQYSAYTNQVARLIEQIGNECRADYGINGTSVYSESYAVPCFESMGFPILPANGTQKTTNYSIALIKDGLSKYGPVYATGATSTVGGEPRTVGHAWVIDGYLKMTDVTPGITSLGTKELVRCNWGWNARADGYYISNAFDLNPGAYVEGDGTFRDVNFYSDLRIVPYIKPANTLPVTNLYLDFYLSEYSVSCRIISSNPIPVGTRFDFEFEVWVYDKNDNNRIDAIALSPSLLAGQTAGDYWTYQMSEPISTSKLAMDYSFFMIRSGAMSPYYEIGAYFDPKLRYDQTYRYLYGGPYDFQPEIGVWRPNANSYADF